MGDGRRRRAGSAAESAFRWAERAEGAWNAEFEDGGSDVSAVVAAAAVAVAFAAAAFVLEPSE